MSRVFVAHDTTLGRDVVVKVLPPDMAAAVSIQRFNREIQLAARLQHPHIVPLHSTGDIAGLPFFTMPFVQGDSLRAHITRHGELPLPECVRVLRDVASALAYAHGQGVVHRDIKPENVLLPSGSAVVTDFGVAKALSESATDAGTDTLTTSGVAIGTPAYMSPEQAAADPAIDHRTDIYSWGVMAYEMVTGQSPFAGRGPGAMMAAHIAEPVESVERRRPTVPDDLASLIMRCLAKRPADRPQRAEQLVNNLDAMLAAGLTSGARPARSAGNRWRRARPWLGVAAVASAAILVAALLLAPKLSLAPADTTPGVRSIAVLPFVNTGGNSDDEYFSDGMSDELSTALGKISGLQVASRTSTFSFKGDSNADAREIGERLHVDAVLEGRVRRAGNRLRLFVQLTNVVDGLSLWSESYEREVSDVFAVQEEVARAIAGALQVRLAAGAASPAVANVGTDNLEAYDLYLRGRYQWHRRNLPEARALFQQAAGKDPRFARAHAGISITCALLPEYTNFAAEESRQCTEAAASKALALDSTLAEAYSAVGLSLVHSWRWTEAEQAYKRAIASDPRYPTAHQWYGELLNHTGRVEEALAHMRVSTELDPLAPIAAIAYAYVLHVARRPVEGVAQATKATELAPQLSLIRRVTALSYAFAGDCPTALPRADEAMRLDGSSPNTAGDMALAYAQCGRMADARQLAVRLQARAGEEAVLFPLAIAYAAIGDSDRALAALEKSVERRVIGLTAYSVAADRMFDSIRDQPRFKAVLRGMNLPESAFNPR